MRRITGGRTGRWWWVPAIAAAVLLAAPLAVVGPERPGAADPTLVRRPDGTVGPRAAAGNAST